MKKTKDIALPLGLGRQPKRRPARVADMVREELAMLLLQGIKEPRLLNVTVTRVSVTDDLKQAIIYYTVTGTPWQEKEAAKGWERAKGFIRSHLDRIEQLLAEIKDEENAPTP